MKAIKANQLVNCKVSVAKWQEGSGFSYEQTVDRFEAEFRYCVPEMENIVGSEEDLADDFAHGIDYKVTFTVYDTDEYGDEIDVRKASCWASEWYDGKSDWNWEEV